MGFNQSNMRSCVVRRATDQVLTTGIATAVSFSNAITNPNSLAEFVTNPTRITADREGLYHVSGTVIFAAGATGVRTLQVQVNGTASTFPCWASGDAPATGTRVMSCGGFVYLKLNDYVELIATQSNGGNLSLTADTTAQLPRFALVLAHPTYDPSANAESI